MPRKNSRPRCPTCGLHLELCLCDALPLRDLPTAFVVVQHNRERTKPTSTGRVAAAVLRAPVVYYGARDEAMDTAPLDDPDLDYYVLFPSEGAPAVGAASMPVTPGKRRCVVVLDGTWHQCSRMARRAPRISELPHRTLPPGPPSRWGVRTPPRPDAVCTFEAATRVVELLHGPAEAEPMSAFFAELTARMLAMRGRFPGELDEADDE
ncbi:MAG: DTW domain-containing protein [Myxococcales bacterium]|nr:DTW domain-containing protein [Myxococcales bacterium]